ncbi:hypothetical protein BS50DRAFT_606170 [Corynespora cassiicola Philippines]|uniref:Aminoglycoside phosphotransferase domain-containing protein n=1 Tax=Corynespora cassiicola Philippines TaxID=1448308 RepID=A0A2T2PBA4_CORCC|nr:hypothetical protein BS50DRAFT_606170 [Corynespora cassiicola Philippines]
MQKQVEENVSVRYLSEKRFWAYRETINETDLYRYTRHRWLINENFELERRYLGFSLIHLVEAISILKLTEGLHNKAFVLTMENGMEIVANPPNPNAGPAQYTTAPEVATRTMAEYILEKAYGVSLGTLWSSLPWKTKLSIVKQIVDYDCSLTTVRFKTHGCLYFKEDLQRLTSSSVSVQFTSDRKDLSLDEYAMSPLTKAELWSSGRGEMEIDRGLWKDSRTYTLALGSNEVSWVQKFARPWMNYSWSLEAPEASNRALELLAKYEQVAPFPVAPTNEPANESFLWHPDLHMDNIFVDPISYQITGIVDWQSADVAPLFYQFGVHRAFRHYKSVQQGWVVPEKPENFDQLPYDEQRIDRDLESDIIHKYSELQTLKRAPLHWGFLEKPEVPLSRKPVWLVTGVWENSDLFFLRDSMITLFIKWEEIFGKDIKCPVTFLKEELEEHSKEEENVNGLGRMLSLFRDKSILPTDGMVSPEDYEVAVENCRKYRKIFLDAAENEYERDLYSKIWPYKDVSYET